MRAFVLPSVVAFGLAVSVVACGTAVDDPVEPAPIATGTQPILGGTADNATSNNAVVQLFFQTPQGGGGCTGTVFKIEGNVSWILTAAHCVNGPTQVFVGPDSDYPSAQFNSSKVVKDVRYGDGDQVGNLPFDIGIIKVNANVGVTPIELAPEGDGLAAGAQVTSYGYGSTDYYQSNNQNSQRYSIGRAIASLSATNIVYDQRDQKGVCAGDSGGPVVSGTGSARRIAGVHSSVGNPGGSEPCYGEANSVRVSSRYDFINAVLDGTPLPQPSACQTCSGDAQSSNTCSRKRQRCLNDSACSALAECLQTTDANTCIAQHPEGVGPFIDYQECGCADVCADQCAGDAACANVAKCGVEFGGAQGSKLTTCIEASCCAEADAAAADGVAYLCMTDDNPAASCNSNTKYAAYKACIDTNCAKKGSSSSSGEPVVEEPSGDDDDAADDDATSSGAPKKKTTTTTSGCSITGTGASSNSGTSTGAGLLLGVAVLARGLRARQRRA